MQPQVNKWFVPREPLPPPAIDPKLEDLHAVVRSTECLRYFVLSTEHWLSPNGRLRWWLKLNLFLGVGLFIPAIFVMPIISLVLHEVDGCLAMLAKIAWKLGILVLVAVCILKHRHKPFPSSSKGSSRRRS